MGFSYGNISLWIDIKKISENDNAYAVVHYAALIPLTSDKLFYGDRLTWEALTYQARTQGPHSSFGAIVHA